MEKIPKINADTQINKLSILVAQDGLYFSVLNTEGVISNFAQKTFSSAQTPESLLREIEDAFKYVIKENFNQEQYKIEVLYAHPLFTLVPEEYFDENKLSDYLKFNTRLFVTDELNYDTIKSIGAKLVYIPYTNINNFLVDKFGAFNYKHALSEFIEQSRQQTTFQKTMVFINTYTTHFDICVFENETLLLANSFEYYAPEDFVYYTLFIFEQLNLNREEVRVQLSGELRADSKVYELLYKYIRYVEFVQESPNFKTTSEDLKQSLPHQFHFFLSNIL